MKPVWIAIYLFLFSCPLLAQTAEEAQALHDRGRECFNANKIVEGRDFTRRAMEMRKQLFGEVNEDYITSLNNYALSFSLEKDNAKAAELQAEALRLCAKLPRPHKNIGMYTFNMGRFCYLSGDENGAIKHWERALPLVEKYGELYEQMLEWLGMMYAERGDVPNGSRIMALTEEHNQHELTLPCDEPDCMTRRAEYYYATGDKARAKEAYLKALAMDMTAGQRVRTYTSYAKCLMEERDFAGSAEYYSLAADAELQRILQLQQQNDRLQLALYRDCVEIADFTDYISYDWKAVQAKLTKEDVAIEFAAVRTGAFDSGNHMVALVLTRGMKAPVALPVCTFADMNTMKADASLYDTPVAGRLVWGRLSEYIKDKRNIYFSADGDFNQMGIEYLQYEGEPLSDRKNVCRLSTTKQLCYRRPGSGLQRAVLFGNIDYSAEGEQPTGEVRHAIATLLMSLRPVDDAATGELMIHFYRALVAGQSPNQALRTARQHLRRAGYDKPEYWASFIVLDGQQ